MPHVIVKLWPGPSEQQKAGLARDIVAALRNNVGSADDSISVAIEEVAPADWMQQGYQPESAAALERLYKKPGYGPS